MAFGSRLFCWGSKPRPRLSSTAKRKGLMDTQGTIDPATGEATEKTGTESTGQGEVAPQASQGEKDNAGQSQDQTEDGKDQGTDTRKPFRSKNQTIYELRQRIREQEGTFTQKLQSLEQRLEEMSRATPRGQDRKPSRTFWEAPEDTLKEMMAEHWSKTKQELLQELQQTRQQDQKSVAWQQETSEAAKFITSQKGLNEDDIADIEELVRSTPEMKAMTPMQRAKYGFFLWKEQHGITDRSALKAKASTVVGAPPGAGHGEMTEEEINREIDKLPRDVSKWTPEDQKKFESLERGIIQARTAKA